MAIKTFILLYVRQPNPPDPFGPDILLLSKSYIPISKYVFHWHHHFLYIVISINLAMICLCGYKHKFVMFSMTKKFDSYTE
jgi:hypothetical protein